MMAVFGDKSISDCRASVVLPLLCASSILPSVISTNIMAADSKYSPCSSFIRASPSVTVITNSSYTLQRKLAAEPRDTSVSMFGARWMMPLKPLIKKRLLMIITAALRIICTRAIAMGLPSKNGGRGKRHITCPIEKYISTSSRSSEITKRCKSGLTSFGFSIVILLCCFAAAFCALAV